ncbi:MAG: hypothetical protein HC934_09720 [Acaryochloridaceae cyanobacterium SU_2_1]|nr:hypothetical protein [Acaryochloridaceae cyanobacterium SU_2_1]NJM95757.1 hypothetical protein [Acaryochloridaceae cyanobacterium CSU_5_19]
MRDLPVPVVQFLCSTVIQDRSLVYLQISKQGQLLAADGDLSHYGLENLVLGQTLGGQLFFLEGLVPLAETVLHIPFLQIQNNVAIELYIFEDHSVDWVILLDSSSDRNQQTLVQQKVNDLSLLRHRQAKELAAQIQKLETAQTNVTQNPQITPKDLLANLPIGEHRDSTILTLRFFQLTEPALAPILTHPLKRLDRYLTFVTPLILDAGGIIYQHIGCSITALFGILPSSQSASRQAFNASLRIMAACQTYQEPSGPPHPLKISQLLTSGTINLDLIQLGYRKRLAVMGLPMTLALQINPALNQEGLMVDQPSFEQLEQMHSFFEPIEALDGPQQSWPPLYAYSAS